MNSPFQAGEAVWVELSTADPEAAEAFYAGLLGWHVRQEKLGDSTYRMCSLDGRDVAGISDYQLHGGTRPGWITYFAVDDVQRSAQQAVSLGGEILSVPRYLPAAGSGAAVIVDPFGAVFGLYQGESRAGIEMLNTVGALCWSELDTGEPDESVAYYRSLFGFGSQSLTSSGGQPYVLLTIGDIPVAGVLELDSDWPNLVPSKWISYFNVRSLEQSVARALELGGTPSVGPVESAHGRLQLVHDPGGHTLCLIELSDDLRPFNLPTDPAVTA